MYLIIYAILLMLIFVEPSISRPNRLKVFGFAFMALLLLVIIRYGQGTDYFNYMYLYVSLPDEFNDYLSRGKIFNVPKEVGFAATCYFFKSVLNLPIEVFSAVCSVLAFVPFYYFIRKYSPLPLLSLFYYFSFYYLIYPYSAIRQAVCIGIFVGLMYKYLEQKRYAPYYLLCLLTFSIHYSSVIYVFIPFLLMIKLEKRALFMICIGLFLFNLVLGSTILGLFGSVAMFKSALSFYSTIDINYFSLAVRVFIFIIINLVNDNYVKANNKSMMLQIYNWSFIIYLFMMSSELISSRLTIGLRVFEIILIADFIVNVRDRTNFIGRRLLIVALSMGMYFKNIASFIDQADYRKSVTVVNYPLVTVFNEDDIHRYRPIPKAYEDLDFN